MIIIHKFMDNHIIIIFYIYRYNPYFKIINWGVKNEKRQRIRFDGKMKKTSSGSRKRENELLYDKMR